MEVILSLHKAILALENEEECHRFLKDLLTPDEINMIANRWRALCLMCVEAPTQREASTRLGVSLETVNTAKSVLKNGTGQVRQVIQKLSQEENRIR